MIVGLVAIVMIFSIPLAGIITEHNKKILELKLRLQGQGDAGLRAELEALKAEVHSLRDTSTQYDLSFDTALQRMEARVEGLERRSIGQSETLLNRNS